MGMHADDIQEIIDLTPALRRYARVLTRYNVDEADDLVQDALERALASGGQQYSHGTNLKAWLMRIVHNRFLDIQRKNVSQAQKLRALKIDVELAQLNHSSVDSVEFKEMIQAFEKLPDVYRRALFLIAVEQLSYEEASVVLDVPVGTVKSRVARARSTLKADLTTEGNLPDMHVA